MTAALTRTAVALVIATSGALAVGCEQQVSGGGDGRHQRTSGATVQLPAELRGLRNNCVHALCMR